MYDRTMSWKIIADLSVATGTLVLAAVALWQEKIRGWFYSPDLHVFTTNEPPQCVSVAVTNQAGVFLGDRVYLRVQIENKGSATAANVEVYANELRRRRPADDTWEVIKEFPVMNLKWADLGALYWPQIVPGMRAHCDVAHVHDPARRNEVGEESTRLSIDPSQTSMAFDLITAPNHMRHIVGPGQYQLDIIVAAVNAKARKRTLQIHLDGRWDDDETTMLREYVGIAVLP
jgi:hypothetical protein